MVKCLYTEKQARILKTTHGAVNRELPPSGKSLVIPRAPCYGGGMIQIAPSERKTKKGRGKLYLVTVLSEEELQKKLSEVA